MSQMLTLDIPFKSLEDIERVLKHFNIKYETSETGIEMRGYGGVISRQKVNLLVKREAFGGTSDMGFTKQADGSWKIECESMDRNIVTQLQNMHLYLSVEGIAKRRKAKMDIRKGRVPSTLDRHSGRNEELVIALQV